MAIMRSLTFQYKFSRRYRCVPTCDGWKRTQLIAVSCASAIRIGAVDSYYVLRSFIYSWMNFTGKKKSNVTRCANVTTNNRSIPILRLILVMKLIKKNNNFLKLPAQANTDIDCSLDDDDDESVRQRTDLTTPFCSESNTLTWIN